MKDDFYNRYLIKNNLFEPIVHLFEQNGPKYNLLNSAIIELFDFIRRVRLRCKVMYLSYTKENIKLLIQHLAENYAEVFKKVDYVQTFAGLLQRYEQFNDLTSSASSATTLTPGYKFPYLDCS
jgi:protein phosphatase-4 regulatory subunit 3